MTTVTNGKQTSVEVKTFFRKTLKGNENLYKDNN